MEGVRFEASVPGGHNDARRKLQPAFNGDLSDFVARQVKCAEMHIDATLGGHFHTYCEVFYLIRGQAVFTLRDQSGATEKFTLEEGSRLYIPALIAHKAEVRAGSILLGMTEEPYVSPQHNDHPFPF